VEINGQITPLVPYDTTDVIAGMPHAFRNTGTGIMQILWLYPTTHVTRTFMDTGRTAEHRSDENLMGRERGPSGDLVTG
jgi:hypothetical protein